jgi:hypothetical protein
LDKILVVVRKMGEHIGRGPMTISTSIDALENTALRVIAMNCPFKRGGSLSNLNSISFEWHMIACSKRHASRVGINNIVIFALSTQMIFMLS